MFTDSCRRLRIMKGSEAIGLGTLRHNLMSFILVFPKLNFFFKHEVL